jgi:hypothetical protein
VAVRVRRAVATPSTNRLGEPERRSEYGTNALTKATAGRFRFGRSDEQRGGGDGTNQQQTFHGKLLEGMNETEPKET